MAEQQFSIPALIRRLNNEADAYLFLEELRWNGTPICPHCAVIDQHYYLAAKDPAGRKTRTGTRSERRVWKCRACRRQFTVLVGTIFQGTKIPVRTWILVILEMCAAKNGISAREIERKYDLTAKTAWFMAHRIREAMRRNPATGLLRGTIIADETYIGGNPRNWSNSKRAEQHAKNEARGLPHRGLRGTDKTPVLSVIDYETREVRSRTVPTVTTAIVRDVITSEVDTEHSQLWSDEAVTTRRVGLDFQSHHTVNHKAHEYKKRGVTTNYAEGYFSQLKRSLDGTHHHVTVDHMDRYLTQFDFMYTHCKDNDSQRMNRLIANTTGRRLTYKRLTGRELPPMQ